ALADGARRPTEDVLSSTVGVAGLLRIVTGIGAVAATLAGRRATASRGRGIVSLGAALLLCFTGAFSSHAAGRLGGGVLLFGVSGLHQAAASAWVGGLVCAALIGARATRDDDWLRPFSTLAAVSVITLGLTGVVLSMEWVASPAAAIGTSYGAMVV